MAYFYYRDGRKLRDLNGFYRGTGGNVCTHREFTPAYDATVYNDIRLFITYIEPHTSKGAKTDLKYFVVIYADGVEKDLAVSDWINFRVDL